MSSPFPFVAVDRELAYDLEPLGTKRKFWYRKLPDGLLELVNQSGKRKCFLKYLKGHAGISEEGDWRNLIGIMPKKAYLHFRIRVQDPEMWIAKIEELGLPVVKQRQNRLRVTINPQQFQQHQVFLSELITASIAVEEVEA